MDSRIILFELSRMLDGINGVAILSSSQFGAAVGVSQQTASRYLSALEREGLINRVMKKDGQEVTLSLEGIAVLKAMQSDLGFFINGAKRLRIRGRVGSGIGEGAYYIKMYAHRIRKELGFTPYYGTLNVVVDELPSNMARFTFKTIPAFEKDGRSFGVIRMLKVKLSVGKREIPCFITLPERTHHKSELELISAENLRKKLNLTNGTPVTIDFIA
jgi:riboflavin kinase